MFLRAIIDISIDGILRSSRHSLGGLANIKEPVAVGSHATSRTVSCAAGYSPCLEREEALSEERRKNISPHLVRLDYLSPLEGGIGKL